ncbi:MAG: hypothetical protein OHK006_12970 [Thermodesulfovibrionales bacterium]
MSVKCSQGCGRETNNKSGICAPCQIDLHVNGSRESGITTTGGEEVGTWKRKACSEEGCSSKQIKDGLCYKHYKAKHGHPPFGAAAKPPTKTADKPAKSAHRGAKVKRSAKAAPAPHGAKGTVPEAALMGAIRKYVSDAIRAEAEPIIMQIEVDLARLRELLG